MNGTQTKLLNQRLKSLHQKKLQVYWNDPPMPPKVAAAKRLLMRWRAQQMKSANRSRDRINAAYSVALNAVMFEDDPKVVLLAIQKFERFVP